MSKHTLKVLTQKRVITLSVVALMLLQVLVVPTSSNASEIGTNYDTAQELDTFFQSVNQRNDKVNETVMEDLSFLRSIHEGKELDLTLLDNRKFIMDSKDEGEQVSADIDYEQIIYDYQNRGLEPTSVDDPEPVLTDIIQTMLDDSDLYQNSFLNSALSIFTETYLIYWAYDLNGNGTIDTLGCGDDGLPGEPCEEGVEEANLASTIWGASTALITAFFENLGLNNIVINLIIALMGVLDEGDAAWVPIDIDEDGGNEIRVRLVPVVNDLINQETDVNPIDGDVGLEANLGIALEFEEVEELNQTLDIAIVRGLTYTNDNNDEETYVWGVNTRFPANETPDEYTLSIIIEEFVFTIGPGGGGLEINPGDVDYVNAPYEISLKMNNQTGNPLNNGIDSLDVAIGYLKYNWSKGTFVNPGDALEEITFIKIDMDNPRGKIPDELKVRIVSQTLDDGIKRDAIEVYAPPAETRNLSETNKKFDLDFEYYELNTAPEEGGDAFLSHIVADITGVPVCRINGFGEEICLDEFNMPQASFWLEVRNESTSERNWTVVEFHAMEPIDSIVYGDYEYFTEDGREPAWDDHDYKLFTGLEIKHLPANLILEGNLKLDESGGTNIPINDDDEDVDGNAVGGLISDLLVGLAGRIVYVGDLLRSIPQAVLQSTIGEGDGEVEIIMRNREDEADFIEELLVFLTSDKYLEMKDNSGDDYFAIYNQSAFLNSNAPDNRSSISSKNLDYSFSAKVTGLGDVGFFSREGITNISLAMDPIREKPFRVYFEGVDNFGDTSHWANITISNVPNNITLNVDNGNLNYAGGSEGSEIINDITFTSFASGIYTRLKLEHLPGSAEIVTSSGDLRLVTDSWFNFTFAITNETNNGKATSWIWNQSNYNGSSVMLYQNDMGSINETASLSGNLSWLKSLRLDDDGSGELADFRINHKQPVQFKVGAIDDTNYEENDKGLDAYVFIDSLPAEIVVAVPLLETNGIIDDNVTEVNDLRDVAQFIEALSDVGKALVDTVAGLSINLVTNVESFETVARFLYNIDEEVAVTAWVDKGNISLLDEEPKWVEGLWSSQKDIDDGTILGARMLLNGLPQSVDANYTSRGDKIDLNLTLTDFNSRETADYIIFREEGIIGPKVTAFIEQIPTGLDLQMDADLVLNATVENLTLNGTVHVQTNKPVGPIYLVVEDSETENPYRVEALIPELPKDIILDMNIYGDLFELNISADSNIDYVAVEIELGDASALETEWVEGITLDMSDDGDMSMKAYLRGISPAIGVKLWDPEGEGAQIDVSLDEFNKDAMQSLLIDVNNFSNKSILLRIDELPNDFDLDASIFLGELEDEDAPIIGNISVKSNKELGSIYAEVKDSESETTLELAVPDLPEEINLDVSLSDDIEVDFSCSRAPSKVILGIDSGDTSKLETDWTHGILLRETDEASALRLFLEGTVTTAKLSAKFGEPDIIDLRLGDWSPTTTWLNLDLDRGVNETAIELFLDELGQNNNINAYIQTGKSEGRELDAIFDIEQTGDIGRAFLKTHNQTRPSFNEVYFSKVPNDLRADIIVGKQIDIIYEASSIMDYIWVKTANRDYGDWRTAQAIVHDVPNSFHMGINPNIEFDMDESFVFQGFPDVFISTSSPEIDVLLIVDEGYTGGHSGTFIDVRNAGDNTTMRVEGKNYIIDSPQGIEKAYLRATNSPATPEFYLDYMIIHANEVNHVEIIPNQIFGLYPVFELGNSRGGELSFAIGGEISIGPIKLKTSAVMMDLRVKSVGDHHILPTWLGIQKNGLDTELGNNEKHYILPEPGLSLIASLEATIW